MDPTYRTQTGETMEKWRELPLGSLQLKPPMDGRFSATPSILQKRREHPTTNIEHPSAERARAASGIVQPLPVFFARVAAAEYRCASTRRRAMDFLWAQRH
jgi:hypothetical protein